MVSVKCANKACGVTFDARVSDRKRGWGKFCSKSCKAVKQEARTGQHKEFLRNGSNHGRCHDDNEHGHLHMSGFLGHGQE